MFYEEGQIVVWNEARILKMKATAAEAIQGIGSYGVFENPISQPTLGTL
jgi:hypothetical protein